MKPPRLPPLIARRLHDFEEAVRNETVGLPSLAELRTSRRRRTLTLAIRKAIAAGK